MLLRFRRLRHRLLAVFLLPLGLLTVVSFASQSHLIVRYQAECKAGLARAGERMAAFGAATYRAQGAQSRQVAESGAIIELLTDLQRVKRQLEDPAVRGRAELERHRSDLVETLRLDVAATQARDGNLDLLLILDLAGHPLAAQVRAQGGYQDLSPSFEAADTQAAPLVSSALQALAEGTLKTMASYTVLADGRLYFALARPLAVKGEAVALLVVGTRALPGDQLEGARAVYVRYLDGERVYNRDRVAPGAVVEAADAAPGGRALPPAFEAALPALLGRWHPAPGSPPWRPPAAGPPTAEVYTTTVGAATWYAAPVALWEVGREVPVAWAVTCQDEGFLEPLYAVRRFTWGAGATVVVVSLMMVLAMTVQLTRPLERLSGQMQAVGQGDLEQHAETPGQDEVALLGAAFNQMVAGLREKQQLAAYVPERARQAIEGSGGLTRLGPQRVVATILFSDLRGFTTMSERLEPQEVVAVMNTYFLAMQQVIAAHEGYVSDFIGDAILAVFHGEDGGAMRGVQAAVAMQQALQHLVASSSDAEIQGLRMGIGLHTGVLVEGDVGPPQRVKFSVLGDTVNTGARIQDASKLGTRTSIVVSAETYQRVRGAFRAETLGEHVFKGKSQAVEIFEILKPLERADQAAG